MRAPSGGREDEPVWAIQDGKRETAEGKPTICCNVRIISLDQLYIIIVIFHLKYAFWYFALTVGRRGGNKKVEKGACSKSTADALLWQAFHS